MSRVTNIVLAYDLADGRDEAPLDAINAACEHGGFVHVENALLPPHWFARDGKTLEVNLAIGVFNHMDLEGWIGRVGSIPFDEFGVGWVQAFVCGPEDDGFRLIELHRDC